MTEGLLCTRPDGGLLGEALDTRDAGGLVRTALTLSAMGFSPKVG
jgi:hypothetical protein